MNDNQFDDLLRDAASSYNAPPTPDLDAMWAGIEARMTPSAGAVPAEVERPSERDLAMLPEVPGSIATGSRPEVHSTPALSVPTQRRFVPGQWLALAATLVIGVALGRASMTFAPEGPRAVATPATVATTTSASASYDEETSRYLGQTAALLISLPSEVRAGRADAQFTSRAADLLSRTRLLIDSPAASDPQMRDLLEDLELVLAQVVRLQNDTTSRTELDLINRAIEQRDVMPRLRAAAPDITAN